MAAPNLQAEGALAASTTSTVGPTVPTHAADDILFATVIIYAPNTGANVSAIPTPASWTKIGEANMVGALITVGKIAWYWIRASGSGTTVTFTRGANWDTGNDTCYAARVDVIRGCVTTGNPYDNTGVANSSVAYTAANQAFVGVTVTGAERMVVQFGGCGDNTTFAMTATGWTAGTGSATSTGTDANSMNQRKDNVSSSTGTDTATVDAPANTESGYSFCGVSFKPPVTGRGIGPRVILQAVNRASTY